MKFFLQDIHEPKEITLHNWDSTIENYSPDYFADAELNFPREHVCNEEADRYYCSSDEFYDLVEWWQHEVFAMNNGLIGDNGTDYSEYSALKLHPVLFVS